MTRIDADMVDMESFAVLRAARRFGVPMVGLRGISDGRSELTGIHDWTEYLHIIDEKLAAGAGGLRRPRRRRPFPAWRALVTIAGPSGLG